jgi:hypothetical protein
MDDLRIGLRGRASRSDPIYKYMVEIKNVEQWLERYPWYLDLSPKRRDWVNRFVKDISPEVFVGMKDVQAAMDDNDFGLVAELVVAYDDVDSDLVAELSTDDETFD